MPAIPPHVTPENPYQSPASSAQRRDPDVEQDEWEQREGNLYSLTNREQLVVDSIVIAILAGVVVLCFLL